MAKKRILIFAPETKNQEKIGIRILENLEEILSKYSTGVTVQKFSSIGESLEKEYEIGRGEEILVVFDKRVLPSYLRRNVLVNPLTKSEKMRLDLLKAKLKCSQNLCDEKKIPYIMYEGEVEKGQENAFKQKIRDVKPGVLAKLIYNEPNSELYPLG